MIMRNTFNIFTKEIRGYFVSPIAYIVTTIFLIITGWFFFSTFFIFAQAEMRNFFTLLPIVYSFIVPAVTMRLFSEEFNTGSYELLLTMPLSTRDIIIGKFLAAVFFVYVMLAPTVVYAISISLLGDLDWGPVIGGYAGALFLGGAFSAIGVFSSSLTRNQIIAFIVGMAICLLLTLIDKMLFFLPDSVVGVFQYIGADYHFQNIAKGIIDTRDILYFVSVCTIMLYASYLIVEGRK